MKHAEVETAIVARLGRIKNGVSAAELAEKLEVRPVAVRVALATLAEGGRVTVVGVRKTGKRGRPSKLYARAA